MSVGFLQCLSWRPGENPAGKTHECWEVPPLCPDSSEVLISYWSSQVAVVVKNPPASAGDVRDMGLLPGSGRSLGQEMATNSSFFAWRISWTEETGRLWSTGLQKVRHDWRWLASSDHSVVSDSLWPYGL